MKELKQEEQKLFPNIPMFELVDLIGKTVEIKTIVVDNITLVFAFDIKERVTYILKEFNSSE